MGVNPIEEEATRLLAVWGCGRRCVFIVCAVEAAS